MLVIALSLAAPVQPLEWIQVAVEGEWKGHAQGPFALTAAHFDEMVANFARNPRGRIVMDWEHQTIRSARNGQPAPAVGWITAIERRMLDDGLAALFARVEWTARGHTWVEAKEYSYVSPVIVFAATDRVTGQRIGTRLHSVALTNNPFLEELPSVALAWDSDPETSMLLSLLPLLALSATATEAEAVAKVTELAEGRQRLLTELGLPAAATSADIVAAWAEVKRHAAVGKVACTELALDAGLDGPAAAAAALPHLQHAGYIAASAHAQVVGELAKLRAEVALRDAMAAGKIVPATEAWARGFALSDPAAFASWAAAAPVVAGPARDRNGAGEGGGRRTLTALEKKLAAQLGLTDDQVLAVPASQE